MRKVNTIVVCKENYNSQEEFENAIKDAIMVLLNNDYIMTVRYDETDIVAIDYECANQSWGCPYPYWLEPREVESIVWDDEDDIK